MTELAAALRVAAMHPELFEVRDGHIYIRPEAEDKLCPCCGKTLLGSPRPRTDPEAKP